MKGIRRVIHVVAPESLSERARRHRDPARSCPTAGLLRGHAGDPPARAVGGGTGLRHARGNPHNLRRLSRVEWPAGPIAASPFLSVGDSVVSGLALPYAMTVAGGLG